MSLPSSEAPDLLLADGFAGHVQAWALAQGAAEASGPALRHAAAELSLATSNGHVCLMLSAITACPGGPADATAWRELLLASGVAGTPEAPGAMPLILDAGDRLYLHRYFDYEARLARRLVRARDATPWLASAAQIERLQALLDALFAGNAASLGAEVDWQKLAAALVLRGRLAIISGGPGTGKTTTVVNLLACLIELDPNCRIALAAPTGKAAARMTEAIRERATHLPETIRGRLPVESFTVHRLLGVTPAAGGFVHHAGNLLAIDALVVDEASMLDLALATRLLEAVPDAARIVLLGDKDQLGAVESGAVFSELGMDASLSDACVHELAALTSQPAARIRASEPMADGALGDSVVWLTHNFRFAADSGIGRLASLINAGDAAQTLADLRAGGDASVEWLDDGAPQPAAASVQRMVDGYAPFIQAVTRDPTDAAAISAAFARFRVLCAVREGPRGVVAMNAELTRRLRMALGAQGGAAASPWYLGRPVLVLRNDYVQKLFNGDIGITLAGAQGEMSVWFPEPGGGMRSIAPVRLPQHETAFAMTVHKSQGSEFDAVLVLLPEPRSRVLARELLYTAVTRASSRVTLGAGPAALTAAITTTTQRHSGLLARLRECASAQTRPCRPLRPLGDG